MKVTGFSFVKNAIIYDYPIVEAIKSILPICNDFIVAVGKSDDSTLDLIHSINQKKIKIVETAWDENLREGGQVLALEANKAFQAVPKDSDWAFYIQGDEVVHEKYLPEIYDSMLKYQNNKNVDGLLFNYKHFYGSYDYVGASPKWYDREIRVIKNDKSIYSFRDAQGFKKGNKKKLKVKPLNAYIYHYGWVKPPEKMQKKQENFNKLWHDDKWINRNVSKAKEFDYSGIDLLKKFEEGHPEVMKKRIEKKQWKFDHDLSKNCMSLKNKVKYFLRKYLNIHLGYKNFIKI